MGRRLRISAPPPLSGSGRAGLWFNQVTDALNQLGLGPAYGGMSAFTSDRSQTIGTTFSTISSYDSTMPSDLISTDTTTGVLTVGSDGTFLTVGEVGAEPTNNREGTIAIFHNGASSGYEAEEQLRANEIENASVSGFLSCKSNDTLSLEMQLSSSNTVTFHNLQFLMHRVD